MKLSKKTINKILICGGVILLIIILYTVNKYLKNDIEKFQDLWKMFRDKYPKIVCSLPKTINPVTKECITPLNCTNGQYINNYTNRCITCKNIKYIVGSTVPTTDKNGNNIKVATPSKAITTICDDCKGISFYHPPTNSCVNCPDNTIKNTDLSKIYALESPCIPINNAYTYNYKTNKSNKIGPDPFTSDNCPNGSNPDPSAIWNCKTNDPKKIWTPPIGNPIDWKVNSDKNTYGSIDGIVPPLICPKNSNPSISNGNLTCNCYGKFQVYDQTQNKCLFSVGYPCRNDSECFNSICDTDSGNTPNKCIAKYDDKSKCPTDKYCKSNVCDAGICTTPATTVGANCRSDKGCGKTDTSDILICDTDSGGTSTTNQQCILKVDSEKKCYSDKYCKFCSCWTNNNQNQCTQCKNSDNEWVSCTSATTCPDSVCFKGDTLILMENNTYKEIYKIIKNDRLRLSDNKIGIVKVILKNELNRDIDICFIDGFYVTPYHIIHKINKPSTKYDKKEWNYAINIKNNIKYKKFIDSVYSLHITMIDGRLPNAGFIIKGLENNWAGITTGHLINHPIASNPFWKTFIVDILNILKDEINENGIFLLKYPEFILLKNSEEITYGIKYKNKSYTFKNNKIVISY